MEEDLNFCQTEDDWIIFQKEDNLKEENLIYLEKKKTTPIFSKWNMT
jgi:hypothetical protein